jgi:hypothetical protein
MISVPVFFIGLMGFVFGIVFAVTIVGTMTGTLDE